MTIRDRRLKTGDCGALMVIAAGALQIARSYRSDSRNPHPP
jgi:hypothetical protein